MFDFLIAVEIHRRLSKEPDTFSRRCKVLPPM